MYIVVTRVQPQAQRWVEQFIESGLQAVALPLIEIQAVANPLPLRQAWSMLPECAAVMFVSAAAVEHFFKERPIEPLASRGVNETRYWCTGPGTKKALVAEGVAQEDIDAPDVQEAQFDSESLWRVVRSQIKPGDRVLVVRGGDSTVTGAAADGVAAGMGRDWLAQQLKEAGAQVQWVMAYRRATPNWGAEQLALVKSNADSSVWLFSSSEAVVNLKALLPEQDWTKARAVATHDRIAKAAGVLGFSDIRVARPTYDDVLTSIKSFA